MTLRSPNNYDRRAASLAVALACQLPSRTKQDQAKDADINHIVRGFGLGKPLPYTSRIPTYGDFDQVNDFQSALNLVNEAKAAFAALPAKTRAELDNDPRKLVAIASMPDAQERLIGLGLLKRKPSDPASDPPPQG